MRTIADVVDILLVEDNPGDVRLTREALREAKFKNALYVAEDGVEAIAFLRRQGKYADAVRPHLILLDLNLPRKDGREVLAEIKTDARTQSIPVLVLTSSEAERDVERSYSLHANGYLRKPLSFTGLQNIVASIDSFWLTQARLPARAAPELSN